MTPAPVELAHKKRQLVLASIGVCLESAKHDHVAAPDEVIW
jgi:hypothetical protein